MGTFQKLFYIYFVFLQRTHNLISLGCNRYSVNIIFGNISWLRCWHFSLLHCPFIKNILQILVENIECVRYISIVGALLGDKEWDILDYLNPSIFESKEVLQGCSTLLTVTSSFTHIWFTNLDETSDLGFRVDATVS